METSFQICYTGGELSFFDSRNDHESTCVLLMLLGRVVRKPVNANLGLKVNRSIDFSCIKMFFASYFLFSLRLFKLKREGQKI